MSEQTNPISEDTTIVAAPQTAGKTAPSNSPQGNYGEADTKTTVSSLDELKKVAPKVYNAMIVGIATQICRQQQHFADRLKRLIREASNG